LWRKFLDKFGYLVRRDTTVLNERLEIVCRGRFGILPYRVDGCHEYLCVITSWRVGCSGASLSGRYGDPELDTSSFNYREASEISTLTCCNTEAEAILPDALVPYHFPL
jgi:hypothetical protein